MKSSDEKSAAGGDIAATYNAYKEYEGKRYTGMKVGRSHKWIYDPGEWKETKVTPDRWQADYRAVKDVADAETPVTTIGSFVVEDGRPGAVKA